MARCAPAVAIVAALVLLSPTVLAYQEYYAYPPWAYASCASASCGRSPSQWGVVVVINFYEFWDRASDGVGRFHESIQTIGPAGGGSDNAFVTFWGNRFTAPYTGTYGITYSWKLSGAAEMGVGAIHGMGSDRVALWFKANLKDVATGQMVQASDASTTAFDYFHEGIYWNHWSWNNQLFYVTLSPNPTLIAGRTYELYTYAQAYLNSISTMGATDYALEDITYTNTQFYWNTGAGGPPCLASGTMVAVPGGTSQKIDKLDPGDQVLSYDLATGRMVPSTVISNTMRRVDQLEIINDGLLRITPAGQPVYARNGTWEGWVNNAYDLRAGMQLFNPADGTWTFIYAITTETGNFRVYDLSVSPVHDFVANGVLVHNK